MRSKVVVGLVSLGSVLAIWLTVLVYREIHKALESSGTLLSSEISWFFQLSLNLIGYATILLPLYIVYKYLDKTNYFDRIASPTCMSRVLYTCFASPERLPDAAKPPAGAGGAPAAAGGAREGAQLLLCFSGLMSAYLVWGLLQEKIMTQTYTLSDGSTVKFADSQFLVFINRLSAVLLTLPRAARAPLAAPLFKFSYCSLTNIVSAWCQYEALHYVSFPTQVLSKSCKVIPVMMMSRLVSGQKYVTHEYVSAGVISAGMLLFMTGSSDDHTVSSVSTASGLVLLALYMVCDSFTSSWQGQLFRQYHVSPLQMMCYVNMFSCTLTGVSLLQHPATYDSIALLKHPEFLVDCILLSLSSALGQLMIYRTISKFGAVVFTIIMTLRQAVSILLSCLVYGHSVTWWGALGIALVLLAVLLRLYARARTGGKL